MRVLAGEIYLNQTRHFAVAFDQDILALDDEALALGEPERFDGFLTHAFMDGHAHPLFAGREQLGPDVTSCKSVAEVQAVVAHWLAVNPEAVWAVGGAYDRSLVAGGEFQADWLDEVSGSRPVVLHANDHHTIWANSAAMALAGVTGYLGVFRETEAKESITRHIPPLSSADERNALIWAQRELLSLGVTAVQDAWVDDSIFDVYISAAKANELQLRTNLAFWVRPESWRGDRERFVQHRKAIRELNHPLLTAETVKFFVDGVFGSATACVTESYENRSGGHGEAVWLTSELNTAAATFAAAGFQLHLHAIGDAAVSVALDAIEFAGSPKDSVIAHAELIASTDIARIARNDLIVNAEPLWARRDGMFLSSQANLGEARASRLYPLRELIAAGARVSFGSDWPVSSPDPLLGCFTAINRTVPENPADVLAPDQRLTLSEALDAYGVAVARQIGISAKAADFVILQADPFSEPLLECTVQETIIGGQTMFTRT